MINLFIEKCWGETGDNGKYYAPPEAEGVWKLSPIQCSMPEKNLQAYLDIEAARQSGDASSLTGEAKSIQDKLDSYYSGSDEGFCRIILPYFPLHRYSLLCDKGDQHFPAVFGKAGNVHVAFAAA